MIVLNTTQEKSVSIDPVSVMLLIGVLLRGQDEYVRSSAAELLAGAARRPEDAETLGLRLKGMLTGEPDAVARIYEFKNLA